MGKLRFLFIFNLFLTSISTLQSQDCTSVCGSAVSWAGGDTGGDAGRVNCGNSAETDSRISSTCTYATATTLSTQLSGGGCQPAVGQQVSVLHFDVRPFGGQFEWQIVADPLSYALFKSDCATGNCADLTFVGCGTNNFSGWQDFPFPNSLCLTQTTHYYLVLWRTPAANLTTFDYNFKARKGCGDVCALLANGAPTVTCNPNGTYTVVQNLVGASTTATVTAPGSTSIVRNPNPLTFTTTDVANPVNTGTVTVTYPAGVNYNITLSPSGSGFFCRDVVVAGNAPSCCTAPVIVCPANVTVQCGASTAPAATGTATYTNGCPNVTVTYVDNDATGVTCPTIRRINRVWTATDANGQRSTCTQTISITDQAPPVITCPASVTVSCAAEVATITTTATATDDCDATVAITVNNVESERTCANRYKITRTYTATDACGNTAACSQVITVNDVTVPTLTCPAAVEVSCASAVPAVNLTAVTATDGCGGTVTVTANDVESNRTCANRYTITRTYTAMDACGNTAACSQVITVNDVTVPTLTCPAAVEVSCASAVPAVNIAAVVTNDACGGIVTVTHVGDATNAGACANRYTITRTYRATDACGNAATCSQVITVNDVTAPTITCPAAETVSCASAVPAVNIAAVVTNDGCGGGVGSVTVTHVSDVITARTCANRYTITRTYRATDACGNSATCSQVITVNDVTGPVLVGTATLPNIVCGATLPTATESVYTATDACGGATVSVGTWALVPNGANCAGNTYRRIWTATDVCGNSSTKEQTIACSSTLSCATTKIKDANCDGFNGSATVTLTGGVAATYKWDNVPAETTATATQLNQGLHNVTVTSTAGCITICSVLIGNTTNLECSVVQNSSASCNGANGSATVTTTGGASNIRFVWDNNETTATATALTAGTHTVQVISGNCRKTCSIVITTAGENLRMGACAKTDATCGASNGSVTAGVISGQAGTLSFTWRNAANQIVGTTERVTGLAAGVYTLTLKDACATVTCSVTVGSTGAGATCTATQKKAAGCADNDGSAIVTVVGGTGTYTYSWDNGETTATATQLSSGVHRVTVTSASGCESICSVTIGSPASTLYCSTTQTATTATVTIIGGNGAVTILWDNGETTATAVRLSPGVHKVVLTDQAGCTTGCSVTIAGDPLSCTTSEVKSLKCSKDTDGSAKVTVKGGTAPYKILWDNGETTAIATNLSIGEHTVTVTDSKGETTTCSISIRCTAVSLTMAACTKTDVTCKGENTGSVTAGAVQGTGKLEYTWKDASHKVVGKTANVKNLPAGTYTLIVQDGCSSATCTVTVEKPTEICEEKEHHFYPAATTCCTYTNGSSKPLKQLGYKSNGHVTEVNPNAFFYYTKIVAPSADFTVNIVQTKDVADFKFLGLNKEHILLWDSKCSKSVKGLVTGNGQGKVAIKGAKVGATYILAVRLETKALLNAPCRKDPPNVTYTLASYINNVLVAGSKGSINLRPNYQHAHLNAGKCSKKAPEEENEVESLVNNSLLVQPNPAQSEVNVLFESVAAEGSVISVANINGAVLQTLNYEAKQGENNVSLEIQSLPVGTYIVTVQTAHQFMTKQLVILR